MNWRGKDAQERFRQTVNFFENEQINTFSDLHKWLELEDNRDRLVTKSNRGDKAGIAKIADATADYYRVLVGLPDAVKVDSRVKEFLRGAGVTVGRYTYKELRTIVQLAAKRLGNRPIDLDSAIWNYQGIEKRDSERRKSMSEEEKERNGELEEGKTGNDTNRLPIESAMKFARGKGLKKEAEYILLLAKRGVSYQARQGLSMKLLQQRGYWDQFLKEYWREGAKSEGQKRIKRYNSLSTNFLNYLKDVAMHQRPYDELGIMASPQIEKTDTQSSTETKYCIGCGIKILRIANYCPGCGTRQV